MADWFKVHNDMLASKGMQFAISEQPLVTSVWLVILSEASKNRSSYFAWSDSDFELIGFARLVNCSVPVFNQCLGLLQRINYIKKTCDKIEILGWDKLQSDYARGLDKGYYKKTSNKLASDKEETSPRGEERRGDKNIINTPRAPLADYSNALEIYEAYPLKVGKPAALRAIKKAMARTSPERLLELTRAYAKRRNGDKYCMPHPATWFNQERYNDEPSTWVQAEEGKPVAERIGPALSEVQSVVLEKCGNTPENQAFAARWHLFWSGRKWLKQSRPMDWQSELAVELAKKGMSK